MKKVLIGLGGIIVVAVAWYLISPIFIVEEANDPSPLEQGSQDQSESAEVEEESRVDDALETMDAETRAEFDAAVEEMAEVVVEMEEPMPVSAPAALAAGDFVARAHDVEGRAILISHGNQRTLRFEDFETINGPNLHIYLSTDLSENDFVDLGPIKATKGNVNYELDATIDTDKYNKVLVWCVPFRVLFS